MHQIPVEMNKDVDWEFLNYAWDLEEIWLKSQKKYSSRELLDVFPEAKEIIPEKIKEWELLKEEITEKIKKRLAEIKSVSKDEFTRFFWREWLKINEGEELLKIEKHLARLKILQSVAKGRVLVGCITEEDIQRAKEVPIEEIVDIKLKRSGNKLVGLCPFHKEKSPSWYIYQDTNSYYCFGCQNGNDVIGLVMLLYSLDFIDAVRWLLNKA